MRTAQAQIPTERASRYLAQLCRHLDQMSRMRHQPPAGHRSGHAPPSVQHVDWSNSSGEIRFTHGTCTLQATPTALRLRIQADDEDSLRRLEDGITHRLETIGRREHLTVEWQPPDPLADPPPNGNPTAGAVGSAVTTTTAARRPHRRGRTLALTALAVLAVLVHLGLLGAAVATSTWASWGTNIILAVILVKVLVAGLHLARARLAGRGRRTFLPHRRPGALPPTDTDAPAHRREHGP